MYTSLLYRPLSLKMQATLLSCYNLMLTGNGKHNFLRKHSIIYLYRRGMIESCVERVNPNNIYVYHIVTDLGIEYLKEHKFI